MDSPGEILNLCRLCLVKDQVNIPIFEEQGDIRQIFLKISSCLPVTITRHDQLPKRICDACSNKLDLLYEFWNSSASAEKTLLSWLGQAGVEDAGEKISAVAQQIAKPAETLVKEESEALDESNLINESRDSFEDQSIDDEGTKDEAEAPPPKRARRTAAVKAQINITPESDEDEDDDFDAGEAMTKMEDESEESESDMKDDPSYSELPGTSADDQAGPSGVGKDGVEAPLQILSEPTGQSSPEKMNSLEASEELSRVAVSVNCDTTNSKVLESSSQAKRLVDNKADKIKIKQLFCQKCGLKFAKFGDLYMHIYSSDESHLFQCANCQSAVGKSYIDILLHVKKLCSDTDFNKADKAILEKNPNEKRYFCERCGQGFGLLHDLLEHRTQHINELLCCSLCDKTFIKFCDLRFHFRAHALVGQIYLPCKLCSKVFFSTVPYKLHYFIVHSCLGNFSYDCDLCDTSLKQESAFISHVEQHFQAGNTHFKEGRPTKDVRLLTCEICAQILATTAEWKQHRSEAHSLEGNGKHECPECKGFIYMKHISNHIKFHQQDKTEESISAANGEGVSPKKDPLHKDAKIPPSIPIPGICKKCKKTFPSKKSLNKHMKMHLDEKLSTLESDFVSPRQARHVNAQKQTQRIRSATKMSLPSGPQRVSNIHKCGICGKSDLSTKYLQIHMAKHLNATTPRKMSLSSDQVQLSTQRRQPGNLQSKLSSSSVINPAILSSKPQGIPIVHKCGACGKSFVSKRALKGHMRTHNADASSTIRKEFDHATFDRLERSQTSSEAFNIVRSLKTATSPRGNCTPNPFLTFKNSLLPCSKDQTFIQPWEPNINASRFPYTSDSNFSFKDQVPRQHSAGLSKNLVPDHERYFTDPSEIDIEFYSQRASSSLSFIPPGEPLHRQPLQPEPERLNQHIGLQHCEAQETHQMLSRPGRTRPVSPYTNAYLNSFETIRARSPEDNFGSLEVRGRKPLLRANFSNVPKPHDSYYGPSRFYERQDPNY